MSLRRRGGFWAGAIGALLGVSAIVVACKSDDNDPCPTGNCGTAGDSGAADSAVAKSCATVADCGPTQKCDFAKAACGAQGQCVDTVGTSCAANVQYACNCSGKLVQVPSCVVPEPIVGGLKSSAGELPCASDGGGDASDGGGDASDGGGAADAADSGDGAVCPAPSCTLGASNSCNCTRPGSAIAYAMDCDGTNCQCGKGGLASGAPFTQASIAPDPCSSISQAAYVMDKYCGKCP